MFTHTLQQPKQLVMKFGYAGLLFFTVKGLFWLCLPLILAWYVQ